MDYELNKLQLVELEICDEIYRICNKHNLKCALIGGSCIGAIRHKGIIPWDDDIDLGMPREDYDKFLEICKSELDSKYFMQDMTTEKYCGFIFGKVRKNKTHFHEVYSDHIDMHKGIWVDIFPYDNVSDDESSRKLDFYQVLLFKYLLIVKCGFKMPENRSKVFYIFYLAAKFLSVFFSLSFLKNTVTKKMTKRNKLNTNYIFPYGGAYPDRDVMPAHLFDELIDVEFNGRTYKTFKEYDYYLTKIYNDYMKLPPEDQRNSAHIVSGYTIEE